MAVMPGAIYRPVPAKGRGRRIKGRGICLHVAASEGASLFGYFSTASSDSHFYVRRDGTIEQYVDTDFVAYANVAGNATLISVETQGGLTNADGEPWTPAQVAALGRLVRWAAAIDGFPIKPMPDSRPTSRGVGYHRLGVKPWVVAGGELWSSAVGKVCPGAAKIAQVPNVIAAALGGSVLEDDLPYTEAELTAIIQRAVANIQVPDRDQGPKATLMLTEAIGHAMQEAHHANTDTAANVVNRPVGTKGEPFWTVIQGLQTAAAKPAPAPTVVQSAPVTQEALNAAVTTAFANPTVAAVWAKAMADEADRRVRDGNPATGPVS